MNIYIKYCGGCNPRFDRTAFAELIKASCPEHSFKEEYDNPDISLVICGCASACANKSAAVSPYGIYTVWNEERLDDVKEFIAFAAQLKAKTENNPE